MFRNNDIIADAQRNYTVISDSEKIHNCLFFEQAYLLEYEKKQFKIKKDTVHMNCKIVTKAPPTIDFYVKKYDKVKDGFGIVGIVNNVDLYSGECEIAWENGKIETMEHRFAVRYKEFYEGLWVKTSFGTWKRVEK